MHVIVQVRFLMTRKLFLYSDHNSVCFLTVSLKFKISFLNANWIYILNGNLFSVKNFLIIKSIRDMWQYQICLVSQFKHEQTGKTCKSMNFIYNIRAEWEICFHRKLFFGDKAHFWFNGYHNNKIVEELSEVIQ